MLAFFVTQGAGCSGCGPCFSIGPICAPIVYPDAPYDASFRWDGGPYDVAPWDAPFSTFDVPRDRCDYLTPGSNVGALCAPECDGGLVCSETDVEVDGALRRLSPSFCTASCADDLDCGPCAACVHELPLGASRVVLADGMCAPRCRPSPVDRGDCLPGFTCDLRTQVCVPACTSDEVCRLVGDGYVFASVGEDASCERLTGRCVHEPAVPVPLGSPCASDLDCGAGDTCHRPPELGGAGFCTRFGCHLPGLSCEGDARCEPLGETRACFARCDGDHPCPGRLVCETRRLICVPPEAPADAGTPMDADGGELDAGAALDAGETDGAT